MPKYIFLISIMISLSGCISVSPISTSPAKVKSRIGDEQVAIRVYEDPRAKTVTPGTGLGAGIIDDMTKPEGDAYPEPSAGLLLAIDLRNHMTSNLSLNVGEVPSKALPRKPKDNPPQKQYALEVYTDVDWFIYRPFAWQTYQYQFISHARLIDPDGTILWQNQCKLGGNEDDKSLQLDRSEFSKNNGKKVEEIIKIASDRCSTIFKQNILDGA